MAKYKYYRITLYISNLMKPQTEDATTQNWLKEAQKGYIRLGVLILLSRKPSHGYEIMKEINNRTSGFWRPTPGGVYPILRDLETSGFIKGQWQTQKNRRLKIYTITKPGNAIMRRAIVKQTEIFNNISNLFNEFARDVLNVETSGMPFPPTPFSAFLDENKNCKENLQQLENRRKHALENIKSLKEQLKQIDSQIAQLKKQANPNTKPTENGTKAP
ncbi:MAG: PadR family transcriptional regulator [Candidatus Bathyarchaeota archaeon]|nr:PadR family transcriptional regulator [Candidatus Bathyarchaeota archaeon]